MYQASVPVFIHKLNNLSVILQKAAKHSEEKKIDQSVFINARVAPDMFPLVRQVQIASDAAKTSAARLAELVFIQCTITKVFAHFSIFPHSLQYSKNSKCGRFEIFCNQSP